MLAILVNYASGERVGEGGPQTETLYPSTTPLILLPYLENDKSVFLIPPWKTSLQLSHGAHGISRAMPPCPAAGLGKSRLD